MATTQPQQLQSETELPTGDEAAGGGGREQTETLPSGALRGAHDERAVAEDQTDQYHEDGADRTLDANTGQVVHNKDQEDDIVHHGNPIDAKATAAEQTDGEAMSHATLAEGGSLPSSHASQGLVPLKATPGQGGFAVMHDATPTAPITPAMTRSTTTVTPTHPDVTSSSTSTQISTSLHSRDKKRPLSRLNMVELRAIAHSWGDPNRRLQFTLLNANQGLQTTSSAATSSSHKSLSSPAPPLFSPPSIPPAPVPAQPAGSDRVGATAQLEKYSESLAAQRIYMLQLEKELEKRDQLLAAAEAREETAKATIMSLEQKLGQQATITQHFAKEKARALEELNASRATQRELAQRIEALEAENARLASAGAAAENALKNELTNIRKTLSAEQAAAHRIELSRVRRELQERIAAEREAINAALKDTMEVSRALTNDAHTLRLQQRTLTAQLEHSQGTVRLLHSRLRRLERLSSAARGARRLVFVLATKLLVRNGTFNRGIAQLLSKFMRTAAILRSALPPSAPEVTKTTASDTYAVFSLGTTSSDILHSCPPSVSPLPFLSPPLSNVQDLPFEQVLSIALGETPLLQIMGYRPVDDEGDMGPDRPNRDHGGRYTSPQSQQYARSGSNTQNSLTSNTEHESIQNVTAGTLLRRLTLSRTSYRESLESKEASATGISSKSLGSVIGSTAFSLLPNMFSLVDGDVGSKLDSWIQQAKEIIAELTPPSSKKIGDSSHQSTADTSRTRNQKREIAINMLSEVGELLEFAIDWLIRRDAVHQVVARALASRIGELNRKIDDMTRERSDSLPRRGDSAMHGQTADAAPSAANLTAPDTAAKQGGKRASIIQPQARRQESSEVRQGAYSRQTKSTRLASLAAVDLQLDPGVKHMTSTEALREAQRKQRELDLTTKTLRASQQSQGSGHENQISQAPPRAQSDLSLDPELAQLTELGVDKRLVTAARLYVDRLNKMHKRFPEILGHAECNRILIDAQASLQRLHDESDSKSEFPTIALSRAPRVRAKNVATVYMAYPEYFPSAASTPLHDTRTELARSARVDKQLPYPFPSQTASITKDTGPQSGHIPRYMSDKQEGNVRYTTTPFFKSFHSSHAADKSTVSTSTVSATNTASSLPTLAAKPLLKPQKLQELRSYAQPLQHQADQTVHVREFVKQRQRQRQRQIAKEREQADRKAYRERIKSILQQSPSSSPTKAPEASSECSYGVAESNETFEAAGDNVTSSGSGNDDSQTPSCEKSEVGENTVSDTEQHADVQSPAPTNPSKVNTVDSTLTAPRDEVDQSVTTSDPMLIHDKTHQTPTPSHSLQTALFAYVVQDYNPDQASIARALESNAPLLDVRAGQNLILIDYDPVVNHAWVYGADESNRRGFVPASYCRLYAASLTSIGGTELSK